ncbi:MAG: protein-L-isoaspartate(D-aspartate) O-methyltransferase [Spongiibacteraceae bacterium]|nr:protein-L-isoaspartate(D-aspartate) O-methyltransferase [Spongiibacteraceae bacterium]
MVITIEREVKDTSAYLGKQTLDKRVMAVMALIPRHEFVPAAIGYLAYDNCALAIGQGQTISQPYIVALMTDLLLPQEGQVVLEIGSGSGYQSAILSSLVGRVYSLEINSQLATKAAKTLNKLGYKNVDVRCANGYKGLPEKAPFDSIIVTAGGHIPPLLLDQLRPGGRMVIPVGDQSGSQYLTVLEKNVQGIVHERRVLPVRFVPLIGDE